MSSKVKAKTKLMTEADMLADPGFRMLRYYGMGTEIGHGLSNDQYELAYASKAYRAFMRSLHENRDFLGVVHSLKLIWERSGSPAGKSPRDWLGDEWHGQGLEDKSVEDRGEAGIFADWEQAAWYAHFLDPENFDEGDVCNQVY